MLNQSHTVNDIQLLSRLQQYEAQATESAANDGLEPEERRYWTVQAKEYRSAQASLQTGRYGICTQCKCSIENERLNILPLTQTCKACAH